MTNPTIPEKYKPGLDYRRIAIGANVFIGAHSTVMPGVQIASGAVVGAYSFVTHDCKADSIYFGIPAKLFKKRYGTIWKLTEEFEREHGLV